MIDLWLDVLLCLSCGVESDGVSCMVGEGVVVGGASDQVSGL